MESYKKKPLRFSGFSKEVRTKEVNTIRQSSRFSRYSFLRPITDVEDSPKENLEKDSQKPKCSMIPKPGSKSQVSRLEMLRKFQEEKRLKKLKEEAAKKPPFKCGLRAPKPLPPFNSNLSRIQNSQLFKPNASNREPQILKSKDITFNQFNPKLPGIKPPAKVPVTTGIKPITAKSKIPSIPITCNRLQPPVSQKPDSSVQTRNRLQRTAIQNPDSKPIQKKISKPAIIMKPSLPKVPNKQKSTSDKSKAVTKTSKPPQIKKTSQEHSPIKPKIADKKSPKKVSEDSESSSKDITFSCHLSMIEPIEKGKKSFAPEGFLFHPRSEWYSSYLLDDAPSAIYATLRAEQGRTSTPLSKTHSDSERKNSQHLEGSFIQNTEIESAEQVKQASPDVALTQTKIIWTDLKRVEGTYLQEQPQIWTSPEQAEGSCPPEQPPIGTSPEKAAGNCPPEQPPIRTSPEQTAGNCPPEQSLNNFPKTSTSTINQLGKVSFQASPLSSFSPIELTASELKGTFGGVKTRSCVKLAETSFLDRVDDSINESPAVQKSASKPRRQKIIPKDFTPRRSARLARRSKFGSVENILDEQPSFKDTPPDDEAGTSIASGLTLDFEKLKLDATTCASPKSPHPTLIRPSDTDTNRVSLLYTPPRRRSSIRKSVLKQDLMSFSP